MLGHELAVEVLDPGDDPQGLKAGDRCAVEPYLNCGTCIACRRGRPNCCTSLQVLGVHTDGGMAPLLRVPARKLHPAGRLDDDQLALVETLGIGAHAVERAAPAADEFVLVIGAGPIGLSVIQFAQVTGARLAVMDVSETRLAFCRQQLGIAHTIRPDPNVRNTNIGLGEELRKIGGGDLPTCVIDATGHTLGAAGIVEAIITIQALAQQALPPSSNLRTPDPTLALDIVTAPRVERLRHAMNNNFGFGGTNCALIFSRSD